MLEILKDYGKSQINPKCVAKVLGTSSGEIVNTCSTWAEGYCNQLCMSVCLSVCWFVVARVLGTSSGEIVNTCSTWAEGYCNQLCMSVSVCLSVGLLWLEF